MSRRTKWILAVLAGVVVLVAAVVVVALVKQDRIRQVPDHFPRAEPPATDRRAPWLPRFGINDNIDARQDDDAVRIRQFGAIAQSGLKWIRIAIEWPLVQPNPGPMDFAKTDRVVRDATNAGLALQVILTFTPEWASTLGGSERTPAKNPEDTDRFVRAVVERYGPDGTFWREHPDVRKRPIRVWEIWNEANLRHFFAPRSGRTYAHHAVVVARAIRSVDPAARILFTGLVANLSGGSWQVQQADEFVTEALREQPSLARLLDGVAMHSYGDANEVTTVLCRMRATMNGVGLRHGALVLNEFGGTTSGRGAITDAQRAARIAEIVAAVVKPSACKLPLKLEMIAPYTWWTPQRDPSNNQDWFGIAGADGRPYPSGTAYLLAAAGAERAYPRSQDR